MLDTGGGKTNAKQLIALTLLAILLVPVMACGSGTSTTATPTPEYATHSSYGFSFQYPDTMSIFEDVSIGLQAGESHGEIQGIGLTEKTIFAVGWEHSESSNSAPPEPMIILVRHVFEAAGYIERSDIIETVKRGHQALYVPFSVEQENETRFLVSGAWFCDQQERTYKILVQSESEQVALDLFNTIFHSFVCH
jgi:hypothetical protein